MTTLNTAPISLEDARKLVSLIENGDNFLLYLEAFSLILNEK